MQQSRRSLARATLPPRQVLHGVDQRSAHRFSRLGRCRRRRTHVRTLARAQPDVPRRRRKMASAEKRPPWIPRVAADHFRRSGCSAHRSPANCCSRQTSKSRRLPWSNAGATNVAASATLKTRRPRPPLITTFATGSSRAVETTILNIAYSGVSSPRSNSQKWMRHRCLFAPGARTKYHLLRADFRGWVRPISARCRAACRSLRQRPHLGTDRGRPTCRHRRSCSRATSSPLS